MCGESSNDVSSASVPHSPWGAPPLPPPPLWGFFGRGGALCVWAGGRLVIVVIIVVFTLCLYVLLLLDFREVSLLGLRVLTSGFTGSGWFLAKVVFSELPFLGDEKFSFFGSPIQIWAFSAGTGATCRFTGPIRVVGGISICACWNVRGNFGCGAGEVGRAFAGFCPRGRAVFRDFSGDLGGISPASRLFGRVVGWEDACGVIRGLYERRPIRATSRGTSAYRPLGWRWAVGSVRGAESRFRRSGAPAMGGACGSGADGALCTRASPKRRSSGYVWPC